jgi:hypothetical protein
VTRRRAPLALLAAVLLCGGFIALPAGPAGADSALTADARASIQVGKIFVQPDLDPAIIDSRSSASTLGRTSLDSVIYPSFLIDAFIFLYGQQLDQFLAPLGQHPNPRAMLGISEARSPQGPESADATWSRVYPGLFGIPNPLPVEAGRSVAFASKDAAHGESTIATQQLGLGSLNNAISQTSVKTAAGIATAEAHQSVIGIDFGTLRIDAIRGSASGSVGGGAPIVRTSLDVVGATVNDQPVTIDTEGVRAAAAPLQDQVDQSLAQAGLTVRLLESAKNTSSDSVSGSSGGVLVEFHPPATDVLGVPRDVTLGVLLGSASVEAHASPLSAPIAGVPPIVEGTGPKTSTVVIPGVPGLAGQRSPLIHRRLLITTTPSGSGANVRGAYAAIVFIALGLIFARPLLRAASRA